MTEDTKAAPNECWRCKEWKLYPGSCRCKLFWCGQPWRNEVDDWHEVYANDAEEAAEKCAEQFDCDGDYTIIRNGTGEIWTRDESGLVERWEIEAESIPSYSASRKS